jgi:metal-responsive CopG/Arc/MetJ family transcriptional regulator
MIKTTLYLPDDLQRELAEASRRLKRPQAELVREALRTYLAANGRPWPKSIGIVEDGTLDARDAKAWVREQWGRR